MILDGHGQATGIRKRAGDATILIVLNAHHDVVTFKLPDYGDRVAWSLLVDTNQPEGASGMFPSGSEYDLTERSCLVFVLLDEA
jgi:isoamylase